MKLIRVNKQDASEQEKEAIRKLDEAWGKVIETRTTLTRFNRDKYKNEIDELAKIGQKINSVLGVVKKNNNSVNNQ